ncbi:MAG: fatty acid desaturase [Rhizobiaceae bacterium]
MNDSTKMWSRRLAVYKGQNTGRGIFEIAISFVPFVILWIAMWYALDVGYWLTLLLSVPTAFMLVRLFAMQHDCGHGSLFPNKHANDWTGRIIGVLTFTPYDDWRREHAIHHAASGNLDRRGVGDIDTLTVREYLARGKGGRFTYRLYRNPAVLFIIGPAWQFLLRQRWPSGDMRSAMPIVSTAATNAAIATAVLLMIWLVGWKAFVVIQLPVTVLAAMIGVWLFYVQHQFEETLWDEPEDWQREHAALHGSSFYDLPQPLMWLSGNIGIHHVHHISSQIPFHRLPKVLRDFPELKEIGRLTLWESIKCIPLALWDEEKRELVSFRQMKRGLATAKI